MTTLHDFGGLLGQPLDTFFWALTISWSRLVCEVALSVWEKKIGKPKAKAVLKLHLLLFAGLGKLRVYIYIGLPKW